MNTKIRWASILMLALFATFTLPFGLYAAEALPEVVAPPGEQAMTVEMGKWTPLIIIIAPMIVGLCKMYAPVLMEKIPKLWIPLVVALIGVLLGYIDSLNGGSGMHPLIGAAMGAIGLWLREFVDQLKKATGRAVEKATVAIFLMGSLAIGLVGCKSSDISVAAQQTAEIANRTLNTFMKLEFDNRAFVEKNLPGVAKFADYLAEKVEIDVDGMKVIRPRGKSYIYSLDEVRLAYKKNRTPENAANLRTAIATLEKIISEAQEHIVTMKSIPKTTAVDPPPKSDGSEIVVLTVVNLPSN